MPGFTLRNPLLLVVWSIGFSVPRLTAEEPTDFFENKVRPLLVEHCYSCHSAEAEAKGKLKELAGKWQAWADRVGVQPLPLNRRPH